MSDLILHHYSSSPFAEKARLMLGLKGLAWQSVTVPMMLPKPDVVALTGGYRRTPFLQVGADIYCDTALIAEVLEARQPSPSLFPAAVAGQARMLAQWADTDLFWTALPYAMQPAGATALFAGAPPDMLKLFVADRKAMSEGMPQVRGADAGAALTQYLGWLSQMLADGRPWLLGDAPCIADLSVYHPLWFVTRTGPLADILAPHEALRAWMGRVAAIGHGERAGKLDGAEAIALARTSRPQPMQVEPGLGFEAGQPVTVTPYDYARDAVAGTLVGLSCRTVTVAREDERAGRVQVHFPRIRYTLKQA
ncbi:Glutathione S-transferase [Mitsuaria sp. PDC51]|jgi:glutathione S-transferase|uniref:glutathione S-transferase family protein n=1 Tax=unclassified Roseateles TaxID=2626991 RepID=UPI0008F35119|nr:MULTISPECIES: glutathione S-transferase family protein [unclassified Roseateles]MBB3280219.1 glutathione S-transferase [Mitsuaria sp. BK037]SFR74144.1 Glutathione S-transferase [Mitsuaria sp. PDC51]